MMLQTACVQDWNTYVPPNAASAHCISNRILSMKNTHRIVLGALTSVVLFGTAFAQTAMPEAGLIGKRYAGGDFTYDHFTGSSIDHAFGAVAVVNLPLRASLDLMMAY